MNKRLYKYVGPKWIKEQTYCNGEGCIIKSIKDLNECFKINKFDSDDRGLYTLTFVVGRDGFIKISDRHSEHIQCSHGEPVLAAGEITFEINKSIYTVIEITNQSTGFCPEPSSWSAVQIALDLIPVEHPSRFTSVFVFRKCEVCGQINIVKDNIFECCVCQNALTENWNFI